MTGHTGVMIDGSRPPALMGVPADDAARFERVVFVLPPGGTAAGRYREWLLALPLVASAPATKADILVLATRGDAGHSVKVGEDWASRLRARLEVYPSPFRSPAVYDDMRGACREFLNA